MIRYTILKSCKLFRRQPIIICTVTTNADWKRIRFQPRPCIEPCNHRDMKLQPIWMLPPRDLLLPSRDTARTKCRIWVESEQVARFAVLSNAGLISIPIFSAHFKFPISCQLFSPAELRKSAMLSIFGQSHHRLVHGWTHTHTHTRTHAHSCRADGLMGAYLIPLADQKLHIRPIPFLLVYQNCPTPLPFFNFPHSPRFLNVKLRSSCWYKTSQKQQPIFFEGDNQAFSSTCIELTVYFCFGHPRINVSKAHAKS